MERLVAELEDSQMPLTSKVLGHTKAVVIGFSSPFIATGKAVIFHPIDTATSLLSSLGTGGLLFIDNAGQILFHPIETTKEFFANIDQLSTAIKEDPERVKQELLYETVGGQLLLQKLEECGQDEFAQTECGAEITGAIIEGILLSKGASWVSKEIKIVEKADDLADLSKISIPKKIVDQMSKRGWTDDLLKSTRNNSFTTREALNKATGNKATAYFNKDGSYIVIDDITNDIIQISNRFDPNWFPDPTIINPYISK